QITLILEELNFLLEVYIDRDLDLNKTLANIPIIAEIYANFKHA
ncbi:14394_t:CDS:1, partial [Funneliformis caledonium]